MVTQIDSMHEGMRSKSFRSRIIALLLMLFAASVEHTTAAHELWEQMRLQWNRRTLLEAYRSAGQTNAAWDRIAEEALEHFARAFALPHAGVPAATLSRPTQALVDLGCEDPLMLYLHAVALERSGRLNESLPFLRRAHALFSGPSSYPFARRAFAAMRYRGVASDLGALTPELSAHLLHQYVKWMSDALAAGEFAAPLEDRLFLETVHEQFLRWRKAGDPIEALWFAMADAIPDGPTAAPWIRTMLRAYGHLARADEKHDEREARDALNLLEFAAALNPRNPEAATAIVAQADWFDLDRPAAREWLDRAISADPDDARSRSAYLGFLAREQPFPESDFLAFARDCLNSERFDTDIPDIFFNGIEIIALNNRRPPESVFQDAALYADCRRYFEGVLSSPRRPALRAHFRARYLLAAHHAGDQATARRLLNELGPSLERQLSVKPLFYVPPETLRAAYSSDARIEPVAADTRTIMLSFEHPTARFVSVIGSFNRWNPAAHPMQRDEEGVWRVELSLPPNLYGYKFFVDGREIDDPMTTETWLSGDRNGSLLVVPR